MEIQPRSARGSDNSRIQAALDQVHSQGGGTVRLHPGNYVLDAPLRIRDHTVLESTLDGEPARLVRGEPAASALAEDADYGEESLWVENSASFRVGMGVAVTDNESDDWLVSTAVITRIEGSQLHLDRRLIYDYDCSHGGRVVSAASMIEAVSTHDLAIRRLVLDGSGGHAFLNGCRGGAIYLYKVHHVEISDVVVTSFNGDGISWQITDAVALTQVRVQQVARYGFHPGTGCTNTRLEDSLARENGSDGLYLCWRVQGGVFARNRFEANQGSGISLGHKDTDNHFVDNWLVANRQGGVHFRPEKESNGGHRNFFMRNVFERNGQAGIFVEGRHRDISVANNNFSSQERPVWVIDQELTLASDMAVDRSECIHSD